MVQIPLLFCTTECRAGVTFAVLAGHHACHDEEAQGHQARCTKHGHAGHAHCHAHDDAHEGGPAPDDEPECGRHVLGFVSCLTSSPPVALPAPSRAMGDPGLPGGSPLSGMGSGACEGGWPTGDVPEVLPPTHDPVGAAERLLL